MGSTFIDCQNQNPDGSCNDGTMISVVSFGCGALVAAVIVTQGYWTLSGHSGIPCVSLRTLVIGILSGATWNAGNVAQIVVQAPPFALAFFSWAESSSWAFSVLERNEDGSNICHLG